MKSSYSCTSDSRIPDGSRFWASGAQKTSVLFSAAGLMVKTVDCCVIYAGAGYGYRRLYWEDVDGVWAHVSDWHRPGMAAEAGPIYTWKRLAVSAGISTIAFRSASFTCGIGARF